MKRIAAALI